MGYLGPQSSLSEGRQTLLQKPSLRTECLEPRDSAQHPLACSSVSTPQPGQLSPVETATTAVVIGILLWVLDRCLSEDWGPWITEKFYFRG